MEKTYQAGTNEGIVDFINMEDLEIAASQVIPAGGYGYISSGAGDLFTYQENERAFNHRLIIPHVLRDVELPDTTTHFDEEMLTTPIIMAPCEGGESFCKRCSRFWDDLYSKFLRFLYFRRDKRSRRGESTAMVSILYEQR